MVFFEVPGVVPDPDRASHPRLQHVAFEVHNFDELLGTYVRLKGLGILPVWAADHGLATAFYYQDPDRNIVEINVNHLRQRMDGDGTHEDRGPLREGVRRSREDARGPQEGRIALGTARARAAGEFAPRSRTIPALLTGLGTSRGLGRRRPPDGLRTPRDPPALLPRTRIGT